MQVTCSCQTVAFIEKLRDAAFDSFGSRDKETCSLYTVANIEQTSHCAADG